MIVWAIGTRSLPLGRNGKGKMKAPKGKKPHLRTKEFEEFASRFPENALALIYVHDNPHSQRGYSRRYAYDGRPVNSVLDMPKTAAAKLLKQLKVSEKQLIARLAV
jgi:hypothetical protein